MFSKFGKEKKVFRNEKFRVKYGTVDATKLSAIYIDVESWIQPKELINFDSSIRITRRNIITALKDKIDKEFFNEHFIVDLDLRSSGMTLSKKSFMFIEITVFPRNVHKFNSELLIKKVRDISSVVITVVERNDYKFYSKK